MQSSAAVENDPIVAEIEVNLSQPDAGTELFVLHHPLRVPGVGIGSDRMVEGVRVRPQHRRIEMALALFPKLKDGDSAYSEKSFDFEESHVAERPIGNSQTIRSSEPEERTANLVAAMYIPPSSRKDGHGCITLVPIERVVHMRPSFDYIDELEEARQKERALMKAALDKEKGTLEQGQHIDDQKEGDENNDVEVGMTFMRRENERTAWRKKASHAQLRKVEQEDEWQKLSYFEESSAESYHARERLFASKPDIDTDVDEKNVIVSIKTEGNGKTSPDPQSYIDMLYGFAPGANPIVEASKRLGDNIAGQGSQRLLRTMRLETAVQTLLTHARIVQTQHVLECIQSSSDPEKILSAVQQVAYLLRGCWVRKTPRRARMNMAAQKLPPRIAASRTLVLDAFRRSRIVYMSDLLSKTFANIVPPPDSMIQSFLEEVSERRDDRRWEFRLDDDDLFVANHPAIVAAEEASWDDRVQEAIGVLSGDRRAASR